MVQPERKMDKGLAVLKGVACLIVFFEHFMECFMIYDLADQPYYRLANIVYFLPLKIFTYGRVANFTFCLLSGYFAARKRIDNFGGLLRNIAARYVRLVLIMLAGTLLLGMCYYLRITPTEADAILMQNDGIPMFKMDIPVILGAFSFRSLNFAMWIIKYIFIGNVFIYLYNYLSSKWHDASTWINLFTMIIVAVLLVLDHRSLSMEMTIVTILGIPIYVIIKTCDRKSDRIGQSTAFLFIVAGYCLATIDIQIDLRYLSYLGALLFIMGFKYFFADVRGNAVVRFLSDYSIAIWAVHPAVIYTVCIRYFNSSSLPCDYKLGISFFIAVVSVFILALLYKRTFERACDCIQKAFTRLVDKICI